MKAKVLFLDRDGVINIDTNYLYEINKCKFVPGLWEALKKANYEQIFVITNQSGIARGYFSLADYKALMSYIKANFTKNKLNLKEDFYCPHLGGCTCRKPAPGLLLRAKKKHNICMRKSCMIGDKLSDMQAGFSAGVRKLILLNKDYKKLDLKNKFVLFGCKNKKDLIKFVKSQANLRKNLVKLKIKKQKKLRFVRKIAIFACKSHLEWA